ncbi:MAG: ATP-dependent Clp protease ATP-binding subunit [Myxococcales bacterium]|nr:ATP-dependent Clp protease ATP-binding subunit [Myxococcales bacterium]
MNITVTVFQYRAGFDNRWITLGLGPLTKTVRGLYEPKLREELIKTMRQAIGGLAPTEMPRFELIRGRRVETVKVELSLKGPGGRRKFSLKLPLIVESRWMGEDARLTLAYHPLRQDDWFAVEAGEDLAALAVTALQDAWAELDDESLKALELSGKFSLRAVAFSATSKSLLDQLPKRPRGLWDDLRDARRDAQEREKIARRGGYRILPSIGENLTRRALDGGLFAGSPRLPLREQLRMLLCGSNRSSTAVIGPSGVGKSVALAQWVADLAEADGYSSHHNGDRIHQVWRIAGKRLIAGMSYLGDWEKRCLEVLDDVRAKRCILYVEDLHQWGRIGRSRDSDRNLAEFFRGPVARRELVLVTEATPEQWRQLEEDAPALAALVTRVTLHPASPVETLRMALAASRRLEDTMPVRFEYAALQTALELGQSLIPNRALPGKVLDLIEALARNVKPLKSQNKEAEAGDPERGEVAEIDDAAVYALFSRRTGLSVEFLLQRKALSHEALAAELSARVMGQPEAVDAAANLILRIRANLVDARRPYGVMLFTGPTGTGKTELARTLAAALYGSEQRLLRFDMGEYATHDAAARLVGDRWTPEGLLTRSIAQQPFSVVLFDEIEKAHPQVHNLLLQLLDEGRLTDASGNTVSFTHAVVIMTSNLGARPKALAGFTDDPVASGSEVMRAVRAFFAPELFNRIDNVVSFAPLTRATALSVAHKELTRLTGRRGLVDRQVFVTAAPQVLERIVDAAFRTADGARSLKRYVEDQLGSRLTEHLVEAPPSELQLVRIVLKEGAFALDVAALREAENAVGEMALEGLPSAPRETLDEALVESAQALEALVESEDLSRVSDAIRESLGALRDGHETATEALYTYDALRAKFRATVDALGALAERVKAAEDYDLVGLEIEQRTRKSSTPFDWDKTGPTGHFRVFDRRTFGHQRRPLRSEILSALAQSWSLRRALPRVRDRGEHFVTVALERANPPDFQAPASMGPGLYEQLVESFMNAEGVNLVDAAWQHREGLVESEANPGLETLAKSQRLVLRLSGLGVFDAMRLDTGMHVWQSLGFAPEIVRVEVARVLDPRAAPSRTVLEQQREARARRDAQEGPSMLSDMLPVVRSTRFDPPQRSGSSSPIEVEDFATGLVYRGTAQRLSDPWAELGAIRMSRQGP